MKLIFQMSKLFCRTMSEFSHMNQYVPNMGYITHLFLTCVVLKMVLQFRIFTITK